MKQYLKYNHLRLVLSLAIIASLVIGCTKEDELISPTEGKIYMAQAAGESGALHLFRIDSTQYFYFGASIAGFKGAPQNTNISFEVDPSLIQQFNEDHAYLDYHFVELPKEAYTISGLESTIEKGVSDSKPLTVSIMVNKLDPQLDYCLPVKIKSISAGNLDTSLSVSYFLIDSLFIRSRDISGTLTVSKENNGGADAKEGSKKLNDNDYSSKYLFDFVANSWMQLKLPAAEKLNAYELTTGNDAPERDPKNWKFQGSNDGNSWTTLDEHTDYFFPISRPLTTRFEIDSPDNQAYSYYRLIVESTNSSNLFQMTEWRLLQYY